MIILQTLEAQSLPLDTQCRRNERKGTKERLMILTERDGITRIPDDVTRPERQAKPEKQ